MTPAGGVPVHRVQVLEQQRLGGIDLRGRARDAQLHALLLGDLDLTDGFAIGEAVDHQLQRALGRAETGADQREGKKVESGRR